MKKGKHIMDITALIKIFNTLSEDQKSIFLSSISKKEEETNIRLDNGLKCPACHSINIKKNGSNNGIQRFICKDCKKSFRATTNTILHRTYKDFSIWKSYIKCMMDGKSLRETAEICGITLSTSFLWRHKILDALRKLQETVKVNGVVEADDTYFSVSYKGTKPQNMPRKSHKRGNDSVNDKVSVPSAVNRNGLSYAKIGNTGKSAKTDGVLKALQNNIESDCVLVTDGAGAYNHLKEAVKTKEHIRIVGGKGRKGIYSISRINAYHSILKGWMYRFKGVATKYLNNYLVWNNQINWNKQVSDEKFRTMLNWVVGCDCYTKSVDIPKRNPVPVLA